MSYRLGPTTRTVMAAAESVGTLTRTSVASGGPLSSTYTLTTTGNEPQAVEALVAAVEAKVSDKPWSDFGQADYDMGQWHRACVLHRHDGDPMAKTDCSLPIREPDGTLNRNGVHAAASRIGSVKGATAAQKKAAAKALVAAYKMMKEDPPESLMSMAGMAGEAVAGQPSGARTAVRETPTVVGPVEGHAGHYLVQLIRAGWSLNSVYYSAEVLRRDGAKAWPRGTLNYVDHDTDAEEEARPAGSLLRLASYQTTDARWDEQRQALVAEVRVFSHWREAVAEWAASNAIGMSIRAWVYAEDGEAEGRKGLVVTGIAEGRSCDYVTVPAAGGAIIAALESVRHRTVAEARNVGAWLESRLHLALTQLGDDMYGDGRLTRDERITLSSAIGDALTAYTARVEADAPQLYERDLWSYPEPAATSAEEARRAAEASYDQLRSRLDYAIGELYGDGAYTWVRDFDPDAGVVWFDICPKDLTATTYQQSYTADADGAVSLDGDRVEVIARVVYEPVPEAAAEAIATPEQDVTDGAPPTVPNPTIEEEPTMSETQTGAPPVPAGTAPVVDTPPGVTTTTATEAAPNAAMVSAMESLTARLAELAEQNAALAARQDERDRADRTRANRKQAREAVAAALAAPEVPAGLRQQIGPRVTAAVVEHVPTTDTGDVDTVRLAEAIQAAIANESTYAAALLESAGYGRPSGLGAHVPAQQTTEDFEKALAEDFAAIGMSPELAAVAARGRG